ncbi:transposase [Limosilactobacillus caecicola]|uniref:transposase n=1 Tax=Limosilactobacillus caecicola TaxID=2941332 RepID=UPI0020418845|nr:transposase [Limosilactobacillus caecicola]
MSASNGQTEDFNNRIKLIKRIAFGYRNFTTFKTRIYLIMTNKITVCKKSHTPFGV